MSSQTMATTMVGRRDHDPPDRSMLDFSDSASDFVDVPAGTAPNFQLPTVTSSTLEKNTSLEAANHDQDKSERNAISNLLAQLARNSSAQQPDVGSTNQTTTSSGMELNPIMTH